MPAEQIEIERSEAKFVDVIPVKCPRIEGWRGCVKTVCLETHQFIVLDCYSLFKQALFSVTVKEY